MAAPHIEVPFAEYWNGTRERLDGEFERTLPRFFDQLPAAHLAAVRAALAGGKRLRGCLVCLLNDALGGDPAAAIPRAMGGECGQGGPLLSGERVDGVN